MTSIKRGEAVDIEYKKEGSEETSYRRIIPSYVPTETIKSIDITELSDEDRRKMVEMYAEYIAYVDLHASSLYNFETWAEQAQQVHVTPKWRAFKISGIKVVE